MKKIGVPAALILVLLVALGIGSYAIAGGGKKHLKAPQLSGYEENLDISTVASGRFEVTVDDDAKTLSYELEYSGLEGAVQQAHVHFGKRAVNGGISYFLCSNLGNGPAGTPACPASGTVTRTIGMADIIGPTGQGIEPGAFDEIVAAMRDGHTYANVHSTKWPGGEIRGQINDQRNG
jgi:hypothetical protein